MKVKKITKPALEGDTYLIAQAVNHNAEVLEGALNRIKELEKRMAKEKMVGKLHETEEFVQSEDMTREEIIALVIKVFDTLEGECNIEYDWSKEHNARDAAIKALEQEPIKDAYIKQVVKERNIAIGQLNELGYIYPHGEKNESCKENPDLGEIMVEIGREEKWLMEAGYNAYNVGIAFENIRRTLRNLAVDTSPIK